MTDVTCAVGCGVCCDPVILMIPLTTMTNWSAERVAEYPDPHTEEGWARWVEYGWAGRRWEVIRKMGPAHDRRNSDFADKHWRELLGPEREADQGQHRISCDAFDRHSRSCTVHAAGGQPPICSGYPRYGKPPGDPDIGYGPGMSPACSYNGEVRTMLPIVGVRSSARR